MTMVQVKKLRHDFGSVLKLLENGEEITITKRGQVIATMSPPSRKKKSIKAKTLDFRARFKQALRGKKIPYDIIVKEREESQW